MESRSFQIDAQWNVIYYPDKPTGFGIIIIGDERHFVEEGKSFWTQNEGKLAVINQLKDKGYTIISSNLFGRNWGSDHAVELAQRVYQHVIRSEILNNKIHILAEGMGALTALKLMGKMKDCIRSVILLNPILSLKEQLALEKEHKFFYKKLMKELSAAYELEERDLETYIYQMEERLILDTDTPIKLIQVLSGARAYNQSRLNQILLGGLNVNSTFILPEKSQMLGKLCADFFSSNEYLL